MAFSFKNQLFPLTLLFLIAFATAARILDEVAAPVPEADAPAADEASGAGSGIGSAGGASSPVGGASSGFSAAGSGATGGVGATGGGAAGGAAATGGAAGAGGAAATGGATGAGGVAHGEHPQLVFFMHDILGGSNPTAKAITGVVTNPAVSGQVPFAKPNGAILANQNGGPRSNGNSGNMNNNNVPFLTGLGGVNSNVMQNNGNNNFVGGNGFPVVNGAQLTSGTSLQQLMFGTMIAIDDELTEGHALNSGMVGRAQGFYVYSSVDGKTQTMAFTAMFQEGGYHNSINFFGVHQTTVSESILSVMGGTGKYVNAKGFAVVKTLPPVDQHESDGLQTVLELSVFLTY